MKLLVIRHAIAEDREEFASTGGSDARRPLARRGRSRMKRGARGIRSLVPTLDVLGTSPLVRAAQTAEIVAAAYGDLVIETVPDLSPQRALEGLLPWLQSHPAEATVAAVGHEPHLGQLVGWLLTGGSESFLELKKGAACLLEFDDAPAPGGAILLWALAPSQLRALAASDG